MNFVTRKQIQPKQSLRNDARESMLGTWLELRSEFEPAAFRGCATDRRLPTELLRSGLALFS